MKPTDKNTVIATIGTTIGYPIILFYSGIYSLWVELIGQWTILLTLIVWVMCCGLVMNALNKSSAFKKLADKESESV